jgi:O-antigen/teichoic acid export membrane protein
VRGAGQIAVLGLGAIAGLSAIGGVRAAQLLYGPLNVLFSGTFAVLVPEGAGLDAPQLYRLSKRASLGLVALSAAMTLCLLAIPTTLGESILGATWTSAEDLLMAVGVGVAFGAVMAGPIVGMRVLRAARSSMRLRLILLPVALVLPMLGAAWWGALGFAWSIAAATALASVCWWVSFRRVLSGDRIPETSARI